MKRAVVFVCVSVILLGAQALEWRNVDADHHLGGRKASSGYLQGKIVMLVRWDMAAGAASRDALRRAEEIWTSFKSKQFVLLGAPVSAVVTEESKSAIAAENISFPVYADAGLASGGVTSASRPSFSVVDETGRSLYCGKDDRLATEAVVQGIGDMDAPQKLPQWKHYLDYELEHLPGQAYNRALEFKKKFPKAAKEYAAKFKALESLPSIKEHASLVAFAKRAKDPPVFRPKERMKKNRYQSLVREVLKKCEPLKDSADPRMAQEAKNSLAELKWAEAAFDK